MTAVPPPTLVRPVRAARRRLITQLTLNRLVACWSAGLVLAVGWFLAEPWLLETPAQNLKWYVAGGLFAVATLVAIYLSYRAAPCRQTTALELDTRFGLNERVTTALGLTAADRDTPAGQAVLADAAATVASVKVRDKFPVRLRWQSLGVPALAGCLALVTVFYQPNTARSISDDPADPAKITDPAVLAQQQAKKVVPLTKKGTQDELDRAGKSEKLKELEGELEKMADKWAKDPKADTPEKAREKVTELTALEDRLKKFAQEKQDKLTKLEQQLQQLDRLKDDPAFADGPAKELNDALRKGDLKKAQEEVDELKKKAKDKKLDAKDTEKLAKQLDKMKDELKQLQRDREREQKLKDMIDKAKKEGKDAEALERELEKMQQENKESREAMEQLAEKLSKAKDAAEKGDLEEAAEELAKAGKSLEDIREELQDLEDAQDYLQRLKGEKKKACECEGECDANGEPKRKDMAKGSGQAWGERPENKDAKSSGQDERIRGPFDPRGKKSYGGSTRGPAFTKRTTNDLGSAIKEAVQEAPQAADSQRLPRDAKDAVKEYFENLGGQKK